jgi:Acetyltransferase (GNAT) family.
MDQKLKMEKVGGDNFDEFFGLILKLAEFERLDPPDRKGPGQDEETRHSARPFYEAYLGRLGGQAVGYTIFFMTYSSFLGKPSLYLEDLFILEEHRGKGHGRAFFDFLFKLAVKRGCGRMEWCALDWNVKAVNFYDKLGARRLNEWIFFRLTEDRLKELAG